MIHAEDSYKDWDEEKHWLLNAHFRQLIKELLRTDPFLTEAVAKGESIQLQDLVERMTENDQRLWQEFLRLDQIKLHMDMNDHLEGRGTPFNPGTGSFSSGSEDEDDKLW